MTGSSWKKDELDVVAKLAAKGHTASFIASKLKGRTRNSVIGVCNRKGIELKSRPTLSFYKKVKGGSIDGSENRAILIRKNNNTFKKILGIQRNNRLKARQKRLEARLAPTPIKPTQANEQSQYKTFLELMSGDCRAVLGPVDGINTVFCAAPVKAGSSWCDKHHAIYMVKEERRPSSDDKRDQRNRESNPIHRR